MIFVEGEILKELPHSKKNLPNVLDRSYGINKVYEYENSKFQNSAAMYPVYKDLNTKTVLKFNLTTKVNVSKIDITTNSLTVKMLLLM